MRSQSRNYHHSNHTHSDCYLFSGYSGFPTSHLKTLLSNSNIKPHRSGTLHPNSHRNDIPRHVKFLHIECQSESTGFDKQTYSIKADVMNILDTDSKQNLTRKYYLHHSLHTSSFITPTHDLFTFNYTSGTYIIRPCGMVFCGGKDIIIVSTKDEFDDARNFYSNLISSYSTHRTKSLRDVKVIISEYITTPLLFNDKKFHLRLYLLVVPQLQSKCKISRTFGKILTAKLPYINYDFSNKDIHDTHVGSTPIPLFFPTDFPDQSMLPNINTQLDQLEIELSSLAKFTTHFTDQTKTAYEVFGMDIMVLSTGEIKLLEINDRVGYWSDNSNERTKQFIIDHSEWQWNEAILPLLNTLK